MLKFRRREAGTRMTASYEAKVILRAYENECRELAATTMSDIPDYPHQWAGNAWRIALLLHTTEMALTPDEWLPENLYPPHLRPAPNAEDYLSDAPSQDPSNPPDPSHNCGPTPNDPPASPEPQNRKSSIVNRKSEFPPHHTCFPEISPETATAAVALMRWYADHQMELLTPARERLHLERDPLLARTLITLDRSGGKLPLGKLAHNHNITNHEAQVLAANYPHLLKLHQDPIPKKGRPTTYLSLVSPPKSHPSPIMPIIQNSAVQPKEAPDNHPSTELRHSSFEIRHSAPPSPLSPIIPPISCSNDLPSHAKS